MSTTSSSNYTTLYSGNANPVVPTTGYGNANVVSLLAVGSDGANTVTNIVATGNITGNYFLGNGSQLTGIVANSSYGDSNVVTLMSAFGSNVISTTGNITGGNIRTAGVVSATGNITGNYILGNGSQLTGLPATYGNANVATYLASGTLNSNIITTANVQGAYLTTSGASGNITGVNYMSANFYLGDGGLLSNVGGSTYSNANVSNFLANFGSNSISTSGNVTAGYFVGNGSLLTAIPAGNITGQVANALTAGTVYTNAQPNITSVGSLTSLTVSGNTQSGNLLTAGLVSATGNVSGNFFIGNGSQLTGIVTSTYGNANVSNFLANGFGSNTIVTTGNVTGGNLLSTGVVSAVSATIGNLTIPASGTGNASYSGTFGTNTIYVDKLLTTAGSNSNINGNLNVSSTLTVGSGSLTSIAGTTINTGTIAATSTISATGNVSTNAFFIGNGSQLTGIVSSYGNANVVANLAALGSNPVSTTGNITGGNIISNGKITAAGDILGGGGLTVPGSISAVGSQIYGGYLNLTGTSPLSNAGQIQANNASLGGNLTVSGFVTAVGNVIANNFTAGNVLTLAGTVEVRNYNNRLYSTDAEFNTLTIGATAGVTGNITGGNILTAGVVSATGNITGNYYIGNGSLLTGISGGTYSNTNVSAFLAAFGSNTISTTGSITSGNVQGGNILTVGQVSATGNVTGNFFIGNGSQLTGISGGGGTPGGANTQIQFNNASAFGGNANLTFNNSTGNVNLGNVIFTTSNATNFINTVAPFNGTPANVTTLSSGQIMIGNGWAGNTNLNNATATSTRGSKFLVWDTVALADSGGPRYVGIGSQPVLSLTGNISNTNSIVRAIQGALAIGGGSSNYQVQLAAQAGLCAVGGFLSVGQPNTVVAFGNTTVYSGAGVQGQISVNSGSTMGNATPLLSVYQGNGNITNLAGLALNFNAFPSNTPTNVYGVYMNSSTTNGIFGNLVNQNPMRSATNYYFLRNDDDVAQTKLGSLRLFNEFQYDGANTSGTLAVDKNNGQVQTVYITGDITSVTFSNFVTSASNGSTTKYQTDTVTLILRQDSTGYTVTMPSGTAYKYAAGANTVGTTANSVTMISVTGTYDSVSAANQYLITISPEFT